jgi:hypothetical protein
LQIGGLLGAAVVTSAATHIAPTVFSADVAAQTKACVVGQRVTVYPLNLAATVIAATEASCRVHYDSSTHHDEWLYAWQIHANSGANNASASQPRAGKYVCMGYNGGSAMFRWYLYLDGGQYRQSVPDLPSGNYSYDTGSQSLSFTTGPYARNNWMGLFSVEREGKTHKVVLRDRAKQQQGPRVGEYSNFYCTNSTDSKN